MGQLDVIIPIFNEQDNLTDLVKRFHQTFTRDKIHYHLIFIDDHSTDSSLVVLKELSKHYPLDIYSKKGLRGKSYSVLEGAAIAKSEYVAMIDGDLQYPPEAIPQMLALTPKHQIVVANRIVRGTSWSRKLISRLNRFIFGRLISGLNFDVQSGLKIIRRDLFSYLNSHQLSPWALDMPLLSLAKDLGYSIGQVDIEFSERHSGKSKLNLFKGSWEIGLSAFKARYNRGQIYSLPSLSPDSPLMAGFIHRRKNYITHSRLPSHLSALQTFVHWQKFLFLFVAFLLIVGLIFHPKSSIIVFLSILSFIYLLDVLFNFFIIYKSLHFPPEYSFSPEQIKAIDEDSLPLYTVMVPLYKEGSVLPGLLTSLSQLDWPKSRLEVLLLLEEGDMETMSVAKDLQIPSYIKTLIVPHSSPQTKPKACNYGLHHAHGEFVVIYDAEDHPDPQQLKKAYLAFRSASPRTVCLQCKLNYFNPKDNLLTRFFTAEYSLWFDIILPGLQSINTTIPLGGTSNHFRTEILRGLHGWDAFNVTEDCDLGARLFKSGYQTAIIDSVTMEEANSHLGNWIRQRSRWIKGYLQTFLVHNRHPLTFLRRHGWHALIFQLIIGLRISFMVINPLLWTATILYFAAHSLVGSAIESVYPAPVFYMAAISLVLGNFLFIYYYMIGCVKRGHWELVKYIYLIPLYWLMVSIAAAKAFFQLLIKPHYWEKTHHGLNSAQVKKFSLAFSLPHFSFIPKIGPAGVLVVSSVFINIINFFYTAFLSRSSAVTISEFGVISLVGSLLGLIQIPQSALGKTVSYRSGYLLGKYGLPPSSFWSFIRHRVTNISLLLTLLWLFAMPFMPRIFDTETIIPFLLFTPLIYLTTLSSVDGGFLQGNAKFPYLALMYTIEALTRLAAAVLIISAGLPKWIYLASPLSAAAALYVGKRFSSAIAGQPAKKIHSQTHHFPNKFFGSSLLIRLSNLSFLTLDIVLAKIYLTPEQAGEYALISTIGKMVYFAGTTFSQFITPLVSQAEGAGHHSHLLFYKIFLITGVSSIVAGIAMGTFGHFTAPLLLGPKAISITGYLPLYTFAIIFFTLSNAIAYYHQIKHQHLFSYLSFVFAGIQIFALSFAHQNLSQFVSTIFIFSAVNIITAISLHFLYPFFKKQRNKSPSSLRILIYNWRDTRHIWAGGAEVYLHELAKRWVKNGHQVTWFCGNDRQNPAYEVVDGVKVHRQGGFFTVYLLAPIYYFFKFRGKYDLIIDSENGIPFFTPLFSRLPVYLLIHHVHQNVFRKHLPFPLSSIAVFLEGGLMPIVYKNRKIITVSSSSKVDIEKLAISPSRDISIINPGIEGKKFSSAAKTKQPSFVYLGRLTPWKNIDVAILAFKKVLSAYPSAKFYIAGWGESLNSLKSLVANQKLKKQVVFLGRVSESQKKHVLSRAWAMLQPSSLEGWGITVIEANACGTPVIASDVPGLRDSVVGQKTGLLVKEKDPDAFAKAMLTVIQKQRLRLSLSKNSLVWAKNFDWDVNALKFFNSINDFAPPSTAYPLSATPAYKYETNS